MYKLVSTLPGRISAGFSKIFPKMSPAAVTGRPGELMEAAA